MVIRIHALLRGQIGMHRLAGKAPIHQLAGEKNRGSRKVTDLGKADFYSLRDFV